MVLGKAQDVFLHDHLLELLTQLLGVIGTHLEAHHRTHIAEHGVLELCALIADQKLRHVLVGHREAQTVFTCFREDRGEGFGGEVLELVNVQEKSRRSFSGISARLMASSWNLVTSIEPRKAEVSSPSFPLLRFTRMIFPVSIAWRISTVLVTCPMILRMSGVERSWPTLFWIAAMASVRYFRSMKRIRPPRNCGPKGPINARRLSHGRSHRQTSA